MFNISYVVKGTVHAQRRATFKGALSFGHMMVRKGARQVIINEPGSDREVRVFNRK